MTGHDRRRLPLRACIRATVNSNGAGAGEIFKYVADSRCRSHYQHEYCCFCGQSSRGNPSGARPLTGPWHLPVGDNAALLVAERSHQNDDEVNQCADPQ